MKGALRILSACAVGALLVLPATAHAAPPVPLDGVVAVVDDIVIFRSDVASRVKHLDAKLSKDAAERKEQQDQLFKLVTRRLIDEVLFTRDAAKLHIETNDAEIDKGIDMVASQNKVDRKRLEAEVKESGYTIAEYREELRRQIIEEKWLLVRASNKVDRSKLTNPAELEAAFEKQREVILGELRSHAFIELR